MRILVVCGAGASSTFVAQRVRHAAHDRGLPYSAFAGTELSLPIDLDGADVVLVGPHLVHAMERIERDAAHRGTTVVLLPPDIFTDLDGARTLALVRAAIGDVHDPVPTGVPTGQPTVGAVPTGQPTAGAVPAGQPAADPVPAGQPAADSVPAGQPTVREDRQEED